MPHLTPIKIERKFKRENRFRSSAQKRNCLPDADASGKQKAPDAGASGDAVFSCVTERQTSILTSTLGVKFKSREELIYWARILNGRSTRVKINAYANPVISDSDMSSSDDSKNICVVGDVVIDWMIGKDTRNSTVSHPHDTRHLSPIVSEALSGGAWFVADAIKAAMQSIAATNINIFTYKRKRDLAVSLDSPVAQSIWNIETFPKTKAKMEKDRVYRLKSVTGYGRGGNFNGDDVFGITEIYTNKEKDADCKPTTKYDVLVIDDLWLGFRDREQSWRTHLDNLKKTGIIVLLISGPELPDTGEISLLWKELQGTDYNYRTVVIVSANALRQRTTISRRISWEMTAQTFNDSIDSINFLKGFTHLFVRFGVVGAAYGCPSQKDSTILFYDADSADGIFRDRFIQGQLIGGNSLFTAWIVLAATQHLDHSKTLTIDTIKKIVDWAGVRVIKSGQKLYKFGYGQNGDFIANLAENGAYELFTTCESFNDPIELTPMWKFIRKADILTTKALESGESAILDIAKAIVHTGVTNAIKTRKMTAPLARFGKIISLDHKTIEGYRRFERIIRDYIDTPQRTKPLNLAVFGDPGSGKSFAVEQIASEYGDHIQFMKCNLTLMTDPNDSIVKELIRVMNANRGGKLPLMLFDEFDTDYYDHLHRFLEPMEDGTFLFNGQPLFLGRCIFVFAGGISANYELFVNTISNEHDDEVRGKKGKDFASRLLGYLDLPSVNPPVKSEDDPFNLYVIRRAILLRSFLEKLDVVSDDGFGNRSDGKAEVDSNLINALLTSTDYNHGARSMRSIIDSCSIEGGRINRSGVPSVEFLRLHIKSEDGFLNALNATS